MRTPVYSARAHDRTFLTEAASDSDDEVRDLGVHYTDVDTLLGECDVVTLHCPLTPDTHHLLDAEASFPNVLITAHQALFTAEALQTIATTTVDDLSAALHGHPSGTEVTT